MILLGYLGGQASLVLHGWQGQCVWTVGLAVAISIMARVPEKRLRLIIKL